MEGALRRREGIPMIFPSINPELVMARIDALETAMKQATDSIKERIVLSDQLREEKVDTIYEFVRQLYDEIKGLRQDVKAVSKAQHYLAGAIGLAAVIITTAVGAIGFFTNKP
jgi:uncharacterized protein (UPF0335 family)